MRCNTSKFLTFEAALSEKPLHQVLVYEKLKFAITSMDQLFIGLAENQMYC